MNAQFESPAMGYAAQETPRSRLVFFRKNAQDLRASENYSHVGVQSFSVSKSKFWGTLADGSSRKAVYPSTYIVEQAIAELEQENPKGPWDLMVFLQEAPTSFRAYALDDVALNVWKGEWCPREEYTQLKERVHRIERRSEEMSASLVPERIAIFVDYQNFYKTLKNRNEELGEPAELKIEEVVEYICKFGVPIRRNERVGGETLVYIFDFYHPGFQDLYTAWEFKGYQFVRIEPSPEGTNPTDRKIIEKARIELEKLKGLIDTVCVVSGDRAFHEIFTYARSSGIKFMVAGFGRATAKEMYIVSKFFCDLDNLLVRPAEVKCRCLAQSD